MNVEATIEVKPVWGWEDSACEWVIRTAELKIHAQKWWNGPDRIDRCLADAKRVAKQLGLTAE